MKKINTIFLVLFTFFLVSTAYAQQDTTKTKVQKKEMKKEQKTKQIKHGRFFVDKDGDGFNDNAPDHDGDGIPNGLDPDYKKFIRKQQNKNLPYVDLNGDGINDNLQKGKKKRAMQNNSSKVKPQSTNPGNAQGNSGKGNSHGKGNQKGKGK